MSDLLHFSPADMAPEGQYGRAGSPGVVARLLADTAAATLAARKGQAAGLAARLAQAGLPVADAPRCSGDDTLAFIGTAPGRWLVSARASEGSALLARLDAVCGGEAALTDQSDALLIFDLAGRDIAATLAKGVQIDLHPSVFPEGAAATTQVAHVGVTFWRLADGEEGLRYRFAVGRSFAPAFLRWLIVSAAEFGLALEGTGRG